MPHKKNKHSKQNQINAKLINVEPINVEPINAEPINNEPLSVSAKVGLIAATTCLSAGFLSSRHVDKEAFFSMSPFVGLLAAGVSELSIFTKKKIVEKYKNFKELPLEQQVEQVVLGIAAYNMLVGTAVGGSFFVIPNAAAREYLFDAALHFLSAYALNSESNFINAIALIGNSARMFQIDSVLSARTSTIPKALNFIDTLNHSFAMFGFGMKCFSKSVPPAQPTVVEQASTHRKTM